MSNSLTVISYFDALKRNNCPRIEYVDPHTGVERLIFDPAQRQDYFIKSNETGLSIRYAAELSDGRIVSLDGALRICNPVAWSDLKLSRVKSNSIHKRLFIIRSLFSSEQLSAILEDLAQILYADNIRFETFNSYTLNRELSDEGHILAGLLNYHIPTSDKKSILPSSGILQCLSDTAKYEYYHQNKEMILSLRYQIGVSSPDVLAKKKEAINKLIVNLYERPDMKPLMMIPYSEILNIINLRIDEVIEFRKSNAVLQVA